MVTACPYLHYEDAIPKLTWTQPGENGGLAQALRYFVDDASISANEITDNVKEPVSAGTMVYTPAIPVAQAITFSIIACDAATATQCSDITTFQFVACPGEFVKGCLMFIYQYCLQLPTV